MNDQTASLLTSILIAAGLTIEELRELMDRLCHSGGKFGDAAHGVHMTAIALDDLGAIEAASDDKIWQLLGARFRYFSGLMDESFGLMQETAVAFRAASEARNGPWPVLALA